MISKRYTVCYVPRLYLCSYSVLLTVFVLINALHYGHGLQCYSCSKEDGNEFCIGTDHISSCSRNQDRCLTQTIYSEERGKLRIDKYCASQAGCEAATAQLGKLYFCDESRQGWGCLTCCEEDLCNLSKASSSRKPSVLLVAMGFYIVRQLIY